MASRIRIKRSSVAGNPSTLAAGELAYSALANNGTNGGDRLYIGIGTETNFNAANHIVIGGYYYTSLIDASNAGVLTTSQNSVPILSSTGTIDQWYAGNLRLQLNTLSSTNTNGNIVLSPNGSGLVSIAGAYTLPRIDGTANYVLKTNGSGTVTWQAEASITIGTTTIGPASTTTTLAGLTQLNVNNLQLQNNTISVTNTNGTIYLAPTGTGTVDVSSARISNVADPVNAQDAATKAYVDASRSGLDVKDSVRAATTANITLSGTQTIDDVVLVVGNRVLVKNQSTASQNGIYVVASGSWTRASDFDNTPGTEVTSGAFTFVEEGTVNGDSGWVLTTDGTITLGSTSLTFVQFSGAGQITAGAGLTKTGNTIDVGGTSNRITVNADSIDIASTYVGQTSITTLGTVTTGTWNGTTIGAAYGGTGFTSYATGDFLYGNSGGSLSKLSIGNAGQFLFVNSNGDGYTWGDIDGGTY